jgi:HlyD family secretion protein
MRWLRWAMVAMTLGLVALAAFRFSHRQPVPKVRYETALVDRGPIVAKVTASGTLSALVTVSVGSQVSGRIESLRADFGSQVKKGQVIATIDASLFRAAVGQARANHGAARAALERAQAQVANAERQYQRTKALAAEGVASRSELDTLEAALGVARADVVSARAIMAQTKAALDQAELNLRYTTIVSPIDGIVISRNVDIGQTVAAAFQAPTLFTIAQDLTRMQVDTNVAEADVGKLREGTVVSFGVDAYPTRKFAGTVRQIRDNAQTLQNVVTYDAVIDVDNSERLLRPGMTANVVFVYAEKSDVVRVPNAALRFRPDAAAGAELTKNAAPAPSRADERLLWLLRSGRPQALIARTGVSDGSFTEVVAGDVHPGDAAIVEAVGENRAP